MIEPDLQTGTWRRKRSFATWTHEVPLRGDIPAAQQLRDIVLRSLPLLDGFGVPTVSVLDSASAGESAERLESSSITERALREAFSSVPDVVRVRLVLDLVCVVQPGIEGTISRAASLTFDLEKLPETTQNRLDIWLQLDVDIFAPVTGGAVVDNRTLATLNAPRLAKVLRGLRVELGATLVELDGYVMADMSPDGFRSA